MKCIYCGRLCDFDPTHSCNECRIRVARNNERVLLLSLLSEAYPYVTSILLREKIEKVMYPENLPSVKRKCKKER